MLALLAVMKVGDLDLPSRIIMAPLTRLRGTTDNIPMPLMVEYYTQRASGPSRITAADAPEIALRVTSPGRA